MTELEVLDALLARRHSVRGFTDAEVPHEVIDRALSVAARTPSWCNTQPWQVIVTRGAETESLRKRYVDAFSSGMPDPDFDFPQRYEGVYRERRLETALRLYDAVGIERGDRAASGQQTAKNFDFFGAPHVAILTTEEALGTYGAVDVGLFLGSVLLAFEASGIGCIPQAALASYPDLLREHFDLPPERRIVAGISFGYEDTAHPANAFRTDRVSATDFTTYRG